jgi:hypothetical protein
MSKRERLRSARRRGRADKRKQVRRAEARANLVYDSATPPGRAATLLRERFGDTPVEPSVAHRIVAEGGGIPRAREVADAALDQGRGPMALSLAADVALLDGRDSDAERYVADALLLADGPGLHLRLACARANQHHLGDALDILDAQLRDNPGLEELEVLRGELLPRVWVHRDANFSHCLCGSGNRQETCCGPAERRALDRFLDRGPLLELRQAVSRFALSKQEYREAVDRGVLEWVEAGALTEEDLEVPDDALEEDPWLRAPNVKALSREWAWMMPLLDGPRAILDAFADDPDVPAETRRRARDQTGWAMWGLWEVADPDPYPTPGTAVTELLTGIRLYADLPSEILDGLPRWSVLLGYLVPVDGVWRAGGGFEIASPVEAREIAHGLVDELLDQAEEVGTGGRPMVAWCRRVHDDMGPLWLPEASEPPAGPALSMLQAVMRTAAPNLSASLREMQESGPGGDGETDPERLWAAVELADLEAAWGALAARPGYELDGDAIAWHEPDGGRLRATLTIEEGSLMVQFEVPTNLAELDQLLDDLVAVGHEAVSVEGPVTEMGPEPPVALPDLPAGDLAEWLLGWPDEPLEMFEDLTPRQLVEGHGATADVEMLVRYLEHGADLHQLDDDEFDTYTLRVTLGLHPDADDPRFLDDEEPDEEPTPTGAPPSA